MCPAMVSGVVTGEVSVTHWPGTRFFQDKKSEDITRCRVSARGNERGQRGKSDK